VSINDDASYYVFILIHTTSVEPQATMQVNVHYQCSDFGIGEVRYFYRGAYSKNYRRMSGYNVSNTDFVPSLSTFRGVVAHELQDKDYDPSNRPDATRIQCLVAWKSESYKKLQVFIHLIESNLRIEWDQVKLDDYYQRYANQLSTYTGPIKSTWLMPNGVVMIVRVDLDFTQRDSILSITISDGVEDEHTKRPVWFDSDM
jgi:hypothetical protein